jgi:hypothetical protein
MDNTIKAVHKRVQTTFPPIDPFGILFLHQKNGDTHIQVAASKRGPHYFVESYFSFEKEVLPLTFENFKCIKSSGTITQ